MSTSYPGDDPRPDEQSTSDAPDQSPSAELPGYWEQRAAEQAREQEQQGHPTEETGPITPSGPVFNPTSAHPTASNEQGSWGAAPPPPPGPSGSHPGAPQQSGPGYPPPYAGQQPYGQHPSGQGSRPPGYQASYGQPHQHQPYGQPYQQGHPPAYTYAAAKPMQHQATLAMILGIVGLAAGFATCGVGLLISPFAWAIGHRSLREIQEARGELEGEGQARAGVVTGIIGTGLLVLALVALVGLGVLFVVGASTGP